MIRWTPKLYAFARDKRKRRESPSTRLKKSRKRLRMKLRTQERRFVLRQKGKPQ